MEIRESEDPTTLQLRENGIRLPREKVQRVAEYFEGGYSQYYLYGVLNLVSKGTAAKLHKLWREERLNFVVDRSHAEKAIAAMYGGPEESEEQQRERRVRMDNEDEQEISEALGDSRGPGEITRWGQHLLSVVEDLPEVDWSIATLEQVGFPSSMALAILVEHDELEMDRIRALVSSNSSGTWERWLQEFRGLQRYVALHYLVDFHSQVKNMGDQASHERNRGGEPSHELLELAAHLYAEGILALDLRLESAGGDIVRYQVWRGKNYLNAYLKAHGRFYATTKRWERMKKKIQDLAIVEIDMSWPRNPRAERRA